MRNVFTLKLSAFLQIANAVITSVEKNKVDISDDNYIVRLSDMPLCAEFGYLEDDWTLNK